jgi:hypothetical protein
MTIAFIVALDRDATLLALNVRLRRESIAHLPQSLDLRLHHVAGVKERVGTLTDAAAGAADENVAGLHANGLPFGLVKVPSLNARPFMVPLIEESPRQHNALVSIQSQVRRARFRLGLMTGRGQRTAQTMRARSPPNAPDRLESGRKFNALTSNANGSESHTQKQS